MKKRGVFSCWQGPASVAIVAFFLVSTFSTNIGFGSPASPEMALADAKTLIKADIGRVTPMTPFIGPREIDERSSSSPTGKGEVDRERGPILPHGAGGPDSYGYCWEDSQETGGPSYNWEEISGTGTQVTLGDDDSETVTLPFGFLFYGSSSSTMRISSNGYLTFGSAATNYGNRSIPRSSPNLMIAPFWDDLNPSAGGTVYYKAYGDRFIVEWKNVPKYYNSGSYTFEAILYADGNIKFQYQDMGNGGPLNSATVGINRDAGAGLQVAYNQSYVVDGLAVLITGDGIVTDCNWLSVSCAAPFDVAPGGSRRCVLTANAAQLDRGTYCCTIAIRSNDPDEPTVTVTVNLSVDTSAAAESTYKAQSLWIEGVHVYPNPATDTNSVHFEVEGDGIARIRVQIFSLSGRCVFDSGFVANNFVWHLQNSSGETLANGVYLYVVDVEGVLGGIQRAERLGKICLLR